MKAIKTAGELSDHRFGLSGAIAAHALQPSDAPRGACPEDVTPAVAGLGGRSVIVVYVTCGMLGRNLRGSD